MREEFGDTRLVDVVLVNNITETRTDKRSARTGSHSRPPRDLQIGRFVDIVKVSRRL